MLLCQDGEWYNWAFYHFRVLTQITPSRLGFQGRSIICNPFQNSSERLGLSADAPLSLLGQHPFVLTYCTLDFGGFGYAALDLHSNASKEHVSNQTTCVIFDFVVARGWRVPQKKMHERHREGVCFYGKIHWMSMHFWWEVFFIFSMWARFTSLHYLICL